MLQELVKVKRSDQNLTSLVRELLKAQIHQWKMARAAEEYTAFLSQNPEETDLRTLDDAIRAYSSDWP